jgi:alpha-L-arabinofuranosidase
VLVVRRPLVASFLIALFQWPGDSSAEDRVGSFKACDRSTPAGVVSIHRDRLVRRAVPPAIFGFNVPWRDFQVGYFRNGAVRAEVVDWLIPFKGASYRYPGGSVSNTFDWNRAVGPVESRRLQLADFGRLARVEFGFPELGTFLQQVDGKAVFTVNLSGPPDALMSEAESSVSAVDAVHAMRSEKSFRCHDPSKCLLEAVELGNELDWSPYLWSAEKYIGQVDGLISELNSKFPGLKLIANGRTAPWDARAQDAAAFNERLASVLASRVQAIAIHPYYEGIPVQQALRLVDSFASTWTRRRRDGQVYVTEHGRWPSIPAVGRWEQNWYQTTSLGGALATADFLLGILPNRYVAGSNWHALAANGPWQLFQWDRQSDRLTPTPLYWALRALREGFLEDVVEVSVSSVAERTQAPSSIRLVGMRRLADGRASLLGVNRSNQSVQLTLKGEAATLAQFRIVVGDDLSFVNTPEQPNKIHMQTLTLPVLSTSVDLCIPRSAVFSLTLARAVGSR